MIKNKFRYKIMFLLALTFVSEAQAKISLPQNLTASDRRRMVSVIGITSSPKSLSNTVPLGGYDGFELGLATEFIDTTELSLLGNRTKVPTEMSYQIVTISKGLYNNVDLSFQFTPLSTASDISNTGGKVSWGFYEFESLPAHLSLLGGANSVSYDNQVNVVNYGFDVIAAMMVRGVSVFTGAGKFTSKGIFIGGTGLNSGNETYAETLSESHYVVGSEIRISRWIAVVQMDRYSQSVFSAKLAYRF